MHVCMTRVYPSSAADAALFGVRRRSKKSGGPGRRTPKLICEVAAKYEIHRAHDAERGPQVVEFQRLAQVEDGEGNEYREGDDFLQNLELPDTVLCIADSVRRHLKQIFEQCDTPTGERGE